MLTLVSNEWWIAIKHKLEWKDIQLEKTFIHLLKNHKNNLKKIII